jgi:O-acetyl-ADP-ribose deacetylase (regulator of RNase III)
MKPQIEVIHGDITTVHVDVIVNAANPSLMGEAAWTGLSTGLPDRSCWKPVKPCVNSRANVLRPCGDYAGGQSACQSGDSRRRACLAWRDQHEASILEEAYRNCLRLAADNGYKTMAFPAISTGVYGYPKAAAATIAVETVYRYLSLKPLPEKVIFVCFDEDTRIFISGF